MNAARADRPPLLLAGGRIIDPANALDVEGDLLLADGIIVYSGGEADDCRPPEGCRCIDCRGKWVLPGLIDMHVHLREPGQENKETIVSGARAAAAGGFTAVACMPNTRPVNDNRTVTAFINAQAAEARARIYPVGAISQGSRGECLAEFGEMKKAGIVAVSDDGNPVVNSQLMRRAMEYAGSMGLLLISHAEDYALSAHGSMNEGALSTRLGLRGIPAVAEAIMVYRDIALAGYTRTALHIAHVSTAEAVRLIRQAKKEGVRVSAETAPHYFTLTEAAVGRYNTLAKMNPPLRTASDLEAIREGLLDGTIDAIATDHAPHSPLEKNTEFDQAANGIIGLETAVPLTMELVRQGLLTEMQLVRLLSVNPARLLGVQGGTLSAGAPADVTVIDPDIEYVYSTDRVVSKSLNSPFLGWKMKGGAAVTIMAGTITHETRAGRTDRP